MSDLHPPSSNNVGDFIDNGDCDYKEGDTKVVVDLGDFMMILKS